MAHTPIRLFLTFAFIITLFSTFLPGGNVHALTGPLEGADLPSMDDFIGQVSNGQAGELRGVYIPGILAAPIVQQPAGMNDFVSPWQNVITQFGLASRLGSTGLLAHNYLAGETFGLLQEGQEIMLIDGSGKKSPRSRLQKSSATRHWPRMTPLPVFLTWKARHPLHRQIYSTGFTAVPDGWFFRPASRKMAIHPGGVCSSSHLLRIDLNRFSLNQDKIRFGGFYFTSISLPAGIVQLTGHGQT